MQKKQIICMSDFVDPQSVLTPQEKIQTGKSVRKKTQKILARGSGGSRFQTSDHLMYRQGIKSLV